MSSGDLIPSDPDQPDPASSEVQFALVIARMIDTVKDSPEHMRQAVYDLARYKLQEQFTHADAKNIKRTQQALENAIRGVEEFSRQQIGIPPPPPLPQLADHNAVPGDLPAPNVSPPARPYLRIDPAPAATSKTGHPLWPLIKRTVGMLVVLGGLLVAFQQRERLASLVQSLPKYERQVASQPSPQATPEPAPVPPAPKPNPLRPTDYGVYAISDDRLRELQLLPGRPPDTRVAVSAALKVPSQTVLPNGHPKFIVFRREAATNISDRAEVRIVAKVAREFSADAAGKKLDDSDATWVIRNVAFPFRSSPLPDGPEMYELHSEDPELELTPGRYALVLKSQAYDFSVEGEAVDPKQCIERIVAANGTFYSDCKKP
jgi:hypothetical protein